MKIGLVIKALRNERGLKLESLANDLDLATSTLSRIESGARQPSIESLQAISDALGVLPSEILQAAERAGAKAQAGAREIPSEYDNLAMQQRKIFKALSEENRNLSVAFTIMLLRRQQAENG